MADGVIALFELSEDDYGIGVTSEKHYRLVPPAALTAEDLTLYRAQAP